MLASSRHRESRTRARRSRPARRWPRLQVEEVEPRVLLSAAGLDHVAALPARHLAPLVNTQAPAGYTPGQIRTAYGFNRIPFLTSNYNTAGSGQTVAIVDAFDDPTIQNDLHTFDQQFGLADPSFTKVNQTGAVLDQPGSPAPPPPDPSGGWELETALDVEWAHAIAPAANILLVEANSNSDSDLLTAVNDARTNPKVSTVSMSWGSPELFVGLFSDEPSLDSYFTTPAGHQGITFVAASGDFGAYLGPSWPAISPNVLAVGGTTLATQPNGTYVTETGWGWSGGGFSFFEPEPSYQVNAQPTGLRTNPDVAYNADPNTGYAVYDSASGQGWYEVGGTSAAAPQWAALVAIADQGRGTAGSLDGPSQTLPALYSLYSPSSYTSDYHDISFPGFNGYPATPGYDLVTGLGSPQANNLVPALVSWSGPPGTSTTPGLPLVPPIPVLPIATKLAEANPRLPHSLAAADSTLAPSSASALGVAPASDTIQIVARIPTSTPGPMSSVAATAVIPAGMATPAVPGSLTALGSPRPSVGQRLERGGVPPTLPSTGNPDETPWEGPRPMSNPDADATLTAAPTAPLDPATAPRSTTALQGSAGDACLVDERWMAAPLDRSGPSSPVLGRSAGLALDRAAALAGLGIVLGSTAGLPPRDEKPAPRRFRFESLP